MSFTLAKPLSSGEGIAGRSGSVFQSCTAGLFCLFVAQLIANKNVVNTIESCFITTLRVSQVSETCRTWQKVLNLGRPGRPRSSSFRLACRGTTQSSSMNGVLRRLSDAPWTASPIGPQPAQTMNSWSMVTMMDSIHLAPADSIFPKIPCCRCGDQSRWWDRIAGKT